MFNLKYLFSVGECGWFCLRKIIGECKVEDKKFMSLYDICKTLEKYNYYCVCCEVKSIDDVCKECITLVKCAKFNYHYVIIKSVDDEFVYFYDPLFLFARKMKKDKFMKKWSKICLFYTKI